MSAEKIAAPTYDELVEVVAGQVERLHINVSDGQYSFVAAQIIEALRGAMVPVGWMYHYPCDIENGWQRYQMERRIQSYEGMSCDEEDAGMTETPLYALPTPENKP